jgi:exonuclease SbcC
MAKFQPKIYSLSTLNIRQHFNCDYRFHDFRTDFSGESGSGKSLIADFIQLLLVGSGVFKSGTEGVKNRDTSGLVLKSAGGSYGRGYILINVEVRPRQYIALGGYLESSSTQMLFFIVQAGYDFEETLAPMNAPVFYKDLLVDGQIDTLEKLEKNALQKGYLKRVSNKKYHHLLFNNGILAVDLSQNEQSLKSYAAIIRSFSRGKGFFTHSDALKTFLFGDADQKRLLAKYNDELQNIHTDHQQHQRLQEEIALIKGKEQKIERVMHDFNAYHHLKKQYSQESASFWFRENARAAQELEQAEQACKVSSARKFLIAKRLAARKKADIAGRYDAIKELRNKRNNADQDTATLEAKKGNAKKLLDESTKYKEHIDKVSSWLTEDRQDLESIRQWYSEERSKLTDAETLNAFEAYLHANKLQSEFKQSDWYQEDYATARERTLQKLQKLEDAIAKKEVQLLFSDLDNPVSLAHWAIAQLALPLSIEQESLLFHFQPLSRTAPIPPQKRYLPFPERLFRNPTIVQADDRGFWLELNGLYEYITYVSEQHLNVPADQIKLDRVPLKALKQQLDTLTGEYEQLKKLREKLEGYPALEKAITLYKANQSELFVIIDDVVYLTPPDLERHLSAFQNSKQHLADYQRDKTAYDLAYDNYTSKRLNDERVQKQLDQIEQYMIEQYGSTDFEQLLQKVESDLLHAESAHDELIITQAISLRKMQGLETELFGTNPSMNKLHEMNTNAEADYSGAERLRYQKKERCISSLDKLNEAKMKFIAEHQRDFVADQDYIDINQEPDENLSGRAEIKFMESYDSASDEIEDKTILKGYSVGVLAHKLLPTVFPTQQLQEELIGEQIEKRLTELANDLQSIGSRKIEILHNVFSEVHKAYNEYLTKVQRIARYLSSNEITGGNYATLQHKPAPAYPEDWMKVFRKRLTHEIQEVGLFASAHKQDISEIMLSVFRDANGDRNAKVEDLLNPRSYFDLLFEIKLEDGQSNSGSNGQTYTANALLCLARLSLIEDKEHGGIRVMPIDEAEGLGGNYEMLHALAKKEGYQIITMSIDTAGDINNDGQYIYIMHDNKNATGSTYVPPLGIFHDGQLTENINEIFEEAT